MKAHTRGETVESGEWSGGMKAHTRGETESGEWSGGMKAHTRGEKEESREWGEGMYHGGPALGSLL